MADDIVVNAEEEDEAGDIVADMTIPSKFAHLHYGKEIVMLADCFMANLLISYMVFSRFR